MKQILYFVLAFVLYFALTKMFIEMSSKWKVNLTLSLVLAGLVYVSILFLIIDNNKKFKDNFTFEVTPAKLCAGGPYMRSSNPQLQELCKHITPGEIAQVACSPAGLYNGRPVHWDHTNMSDDMWQNKMCDDSKFTSPCVL